MEEIRVNEERKEGRLQEMERALEVMRDEVREKHSSTLNSLVQQTDSPFVHQILDYLAPLKYRAPPVETFDRVGDPTDHLKIFKGHMTYQGVGDTLMCRAFPLTLRKFAQTHTEEIRPKVVWATAP